MNYESIGNVINILRWLRSQDLGQPMAIHLRGLIGTISDGRTPSDASVFRVAASMRDQIDEAGSVINASTELTDEQKIGIQSAIDTMVTVFSVESLASNQNGVLRNIPMMISLLSGFRIQDHQKAVEKSTDVANEIKDILRSLEEMELDHHVKTTAREHLMVLITLLQHVPIFGVEAAMATYYDLVIRLRKAKAQAEPKSSAATALGKLFAHIEKLAGHISTLDKLWNAGSKVLDHAGSAQNLLSHLPHP